jgi:hypothetical protein
MKLSQKRAINLIDSKGILLVFPKNNQKDPASLWSQFFPKSKMKWEWDDDGDDRVAQMWGLMKSLSSRTEVVYSKWYQGRATFFSREVFAALLAFRNKLELQKNLKPLSPEAREILSLLEDNSPLSTKVIKKEVALQGKRLESVYAKAMKELFCRLDIVAFGEVDDGAFPSLAIGATSLLFEDLVKDARLFSEKESQRVIEEFLPQESLWRREWNRHLLRM